MLFVHSRERDDYDLPILNSKRKIRRIRMDGN